MMKEIPIDFLAQIIIFRLHCDHENILKGNEKFGRYIFQ